MQPQTVDSVLLNAGFPSKELVQDAVTTAVLTLVNQARFALLRHDGRGDSELWSLLAGKEPVANLAAYANPDTDAKELGITFSDVAGTSLAKTIMVLYDYGVLGIEDSSADPLDNSEGDANWTARILHDLANSTFLQEWTGYAGPGPLEAVQRCLWIAELANARVLLEDGKEAFFLEQRETGLLTFRQLALLSGMTEASLRTLASRGAKGTSAQDGTALRTLKHGNASYIEVADARAWLKARHRYVSIRRVSDRGAAPLADLRFASIQDLEEAIDHRVRYLCAELGPEAVEARMRATGIEVMRERFDDQTYYRVPQADYMRREPMRLLGKALDWSPEIFALRAAETFLGEQLRQVEQEIKAAKA